MRIKLDNKNHYLVSDEHNCWIVTECKTAKGDTYDRRQSGYYGDIDGAMQSYFDKSQRLADADLVVVPSVYGVAGCDVELKPTTWQIQQCRKLLAIGTIEGTKGD